MERFATILSVVGLLTGFLPGYLIHECSHYWVGKRYSEVKIRLLKAHVQAIEPFDFTPKQWRQFCIAPYVVTLPMLTILTIYFYPFNVAETGFVIGFFSFGPRPSGSDVLGIVHPQLSQQLNAKYGRPPKAKESWIQVLSTIGVLNQNGPRAND